MTTPPVIDLGYLRDFTNGEAGMERELLALFYTQSEKNLLAMQEHSVSGDHEAWVEAAHLLRGSSGCIGATQLQDLCKQAQHAANSAAEKTALLKQIREAYAQVQQALQCALAPPAG